MTEIHPEIAEHVMEENEKLREALRWYEEKVAECRKIGSLGDNARQALDLDGGFRARDALAQQAEPATAQDEREIIGVERYRVVRFSGNFGIACVKAGDGERKLFQGHINDCERVAAELATAFEDGKFVAAPIAQTAPQGKFRMGDMVKKTTGSEWQGRICGTYSTALTPEGYAVESEAHAGSVQIYPAKALELVPMAAKEA